MDKMWQMYIHSGIGLPEMSFNEFKAKVLKSPPQENQSQHQPNSYSMTNEQVDETLKKSRGILRGFSMKD